MNECSSNNGGCEHNCQNTQGSFRCTCNSGFTLNSDQRRCTGQWTHARTLALRTYIERSYLIADINECTRGTDNCAQRCTNTPGSFTCSCNAGYRLASNRLSCSGKLTSCNTVCTRSIFCTFLDINECSGGSDNCAQRCTNTIGSFTCSCNTGYTLSSNRRTCNGRYTNSRYTKTQVYHLYNISQA